MKLRTKYIINPKLQYTLIAVAVVMSLLGFLVLEGFVIKYQSEVNASLAAAGIAKSHPLASYVDLQHQKLQKILGAVGIAVTVMNVLVLTWISQRIAGPVYRLHVSMQNLLNGTQNHPVRLRKGDFFADTAALLESIRKRGVKD